MLNPAVESLGEKRPQGHGDPARKEQQDRRQEQVMFAHKHQPGRDPHIDECQQAGNHISA